MVPLNVETYQIWSSRTSWTWLCGLFLCLYKQIQRSFSMLGYLQNYLSRLWQKYHKNHQFHLLLDKLDKGQCQLIALFCFKNMLKREVQSEIGSVMLVDELCNMYAFTRYGIIFTCLKKKPANCAPYCHLLLNLPHNHFKWQYFRITGYLPDWLIWWPSALWDHL
jgi:hypothetical protein